MEQLLLTYGLPKKSVSAKVMVYKNMKALVCSPDGNTDFFDIAVGVLQGDIAPYLFIFCVDTLDIHRSYK